MKGIRAVLQLQEISHLAKVQKFLESIARSSFQTMKVYKIGLSYFQTFLNDTQGVYNNLELILEPLIKNEINVYSLMDDFVSYILNHTKNVTLSSNSLNVYLAAVRSYFAYYDIDIVAAKFKRRVKIPKFCREDELAIDASDIRRILLSCNNRRLKSYLLVLSSGGMRAIEALAIRNKDIDFDATLTKIHIRKEFTKTGVARDIYISGEATMFLKQWLDWKYQTSRKDKLSPPYPPEELVFYARNYNMDRATPHGIYQRVVMEFQKLLKVVEMDQRKDGLQRRRKITLHSLRRHTKTIISTQVGQDYSEWFLGHAKSPYWTMKEAQKSEIYATRIMKHLTFLDYSQLEVEGKNIGSRLSEKDKEIELLKQCESYNSDAIATLSDQITNLTQEVLMLKNQNKT
jgi:integrase